MPLVISLIYSDIKVGLYSDYKLGVISYEEYHDTQRNSNGDISQSRQGSSGDDGYSAGAVAQGEFKQVQELRI